MPRTELTNIDWRETSFVPAGDNPPARIVMWKKDLTDGEIEEVLQEVEMGALTKQADVVAVVQKKAEELVKADPTESLTIAQARVEVWLENPDLRQRFYELEAAQAERLNSIVSGGERPVVKGASAFAKLDADAQARYPDLYDRSPSAARVKAREKRPDLGEAYDREFGAR